MTRALSILYVDDEPDIRLIVEMSLSISPELTVRTAGSGEEALGLLIDQRWRPDVLMVDVMMPGLTGPDVLAALRAEPATEDLPVIFVTARARPQDVDTYVKLGARGVITKPFDPMKLADQLLTLIG